MLQRPQSAGTVTLGVVLCLGAAAAAAIVAWRRRAHPEGPGLWGAIRSFRPWREHRPKGVTIH